MLLIRVVSLKGRPTGPEMTARFGEAGGTIGRGDNNTLVLPDPERFISRTHATISFQAGGFIITDNGTKNPLVLNGRGLGPGSQARLADGDQIKLGDYILEVGLAARATPAKPPAKATAASKATDPFADLLLPPERSAPRTTPVNRPDTEPIVPAVAIPATPRIPDPLTSDPLASLRAREPSIDDIFGLKSQGAREVAATDFLQPKTGAHAEGRGVVDPLEAFGGVVKPVRRHRSPTMETRSSRLIARRPPGQTRASNPSPSPRPPGFNPPLLPPRRSRRPSRGPWRPRRTPTSSRRSFRAPEFQTFRRREISARRRCMRSAPCCARRCRARSIFYAPVVSRRARCARTSPSSCRWTTTR